ncbi:MAG: hypothetical protein NT069_15110, partial [Planctomycetota bacterium]|nr:hypothetical protein [Planctomycetota bacterium]
APWSETRESQKPAVREQETGVLQPTIDSSPPAQKTEADLRQSPEWKRASRQERKRLMRAARASPELEAVPSRDP